jgi:hypothetical protein
MFDQLSPAVSKTNTQYVSCWMLLGFCLLHNRTATALLGAAHIKWMLAAADISQLIQSALQKQALTLHRVKWCCAALACWCITSKAVAAAHVSACSISTSLLPIKPYTPAA